MTLEFHRVIDAYTATIRRLLNDLDDNELRGMLKDPQKLDDLINNQNQINLMPEMRDDKLRLCRWFANLNMSMKPKFEELKTSLISDAAELRHLDLEIKDLKHKVDSINDDRRLDVVEDLLSVAISQANEISETLSDDFIAGRLPIDDFIQQHDVYRRLYHMRKLQAGKLMEFLRQQF